MLDIPNYLKGQLYNIHLEKLGGIRFTAREIDVMACLLHNRGEKKIAALLSISYRTVSVHVRNIMSKLGCNSRESIIDFVENSGKKKFFRQCYYYLAINTIIEKQLKKIGSRLGRLPIICSIDIDLLNEEEKILARHITHSLNIAGLLVSTSAPAQMENLKKYNLHFFPRTPNFQAEANNIALITEYAKEEALISESVKAISFSKEISYFDAISNLLIEITNNPNITHIKKEFDIEYEAIRASLEDNELKNLNLNKHSQLKFPPGLIVIIFSSLMIVAISIIAVFFFTNNIKGNAVAEPQVFAGTDPKKLLTNYYEHLSVRNIENKEAEKNYTIIKQFEHVIDEIISGKLDKSHYVNYLQSEELINIIYNLNSVASYLRYKKNEAAQSEKVLLFAKDLAESYISKRSKAPIDFSKLSPEEIYTEISIISDLPELYAITTYFLGRSYIYLKNFKDGERCLKISEYLGSRLGLFEEVLSNIYGLAVIKEREIDQHIADKEYEKAKTGILECIKIYEKVKNSPKIYKKNYRSSNHQVIIIIPKDDTYNIVDCTRYIINLYGKLITIENDKNRKTEYFTKAVSHIIDKNKNSKILKALIESKEQLNRMTANFYNCLAFFLLTAIRYEIDCRDFCNKLARIINFGVDNCTDNQLKIIANIFELAKSLSRNTEFAKANSYEGLSKTYELMLESSDLTSQERQELPVKIQEYNNLKDSIIKALKESQIK